MDCRSCSYFPTLYTFVLPIVSIRTEMEFKTVWASRYILTSGSKIGYINRVVLLAIDPSTSQVSIGVEGDYGNSTKHCLSRIIEILWPFSGTDSSARILNPCLDWCRLFGQACSLS
jgi:hypothetical protein